MKSNQELVHWAYLETYVHGHLTLKCHTNYIHTINKCPQMSTNNFPITMSGDENSLPRPRRITFVRSPVRPHEGGRVIKHWTLSLSPTSKTAARLCTRRRQGFQRGSANPVIDINTSGLGRVMSYRNFWELWECPWTCQINGPKQFGESLRRNGQCNGQRRLLWDAPKMAGIAE